MLKWNINIQLKVKMLPTNWNKISLSRCTKAKSTKSTKSRNNNKKTNS